MKAVSINNEIKVFFSLPTDWKNYLNFKEASLELQHQEGFYDVVTPSYNTSLQKLGAIYFDGGNSIFTYPVIDKTLEELALEKEQLLNDIETNFDIIAIKKLLVILTKDILNSETVTQDQLDTLVTIYPPYRENKAYALNDVFMFENNLYRVVQAHTSQADWIPSSTPALYTKYVPSGTISEWVQPTGAQDAYQIGVQVSHLGKIWENVVSNNVWEPGVYGWIEII